MSPPSERLPATSRLEGLAWPLTVVSVVAMTSSLHLFSEVRRSTSLFTSATAYVPDLAVLALLALGTPLLWQRRSSTGSLPRATVALGALSAALVPSLLAHPSPRGAMVVAHWAGAAVLAGLVSGTDWRHRSTLAAVLAAVVTVQAAVALAQQNLGILPGRLMPWFFGEVRAPVVPVGQSWAASGTTMHPYVLAALVCAVFGVCMAAALRRWAPAVTVAWGSAAAGGALALTASRAGVLAAVAVTAVAVVGSIRQPASRSAVRNAALAFLAGAVLFLVCAPNPWTARYDQLNQPGADQLSGRGELIHEALGLVREHPLLGVGPGRYTRALRDDPDGSAYGTREPAPVHLVPLLVVTEAGIPGLLGLAALVLVVAGLARRAGAAGLAVLAGLGPFVLLDHLTYTHAQGVLLAGMCLGFVELAALTTDSGGKGRRDVRTLAGLRSDKGGPSR